MIIKIKAYSKIHKRWFNWSRDIIGDIIEDVPDKIKKDGFWRQVKITRKDKKIKLLTKNTNILK